MKIAFAGKGGVGKTSLAAWFSQYLATMGQDVWLIDADTAPSLGMASGLKPEELPAPLAKQEDLIREYIGAEGLMCLNPDVGPLLEKFAVLLPSRAETGRQASGQALGQALGQAGREGQKRLILMGTVENALGGCACSAHALLRAVLSALVFGQETSVVIDMEAGVEHLGRGTLVGIDGLVVVSEATERSFFTAAEVSRLAAEMGIKKQVLVINKAPGTAQNPRDFLDKSAFKDTLTLPCLFLPRLAGLDTMALTESSVLGMQNKAEQAQVDVLCRELAEYFGI